MKVYDYINGCDEKQKQRMNEKREHGEHIQEK